MPKKNKYTHTVTWELEGTFDSEGGNQNESLLEVVGDIGEIESALRNLGGGLTVGRRSVRTQPRREQERVGIEAPGNTGAAPDVSEFESADGEVPAIEGKAGSK